MSKILNPDLCIIGAGVGGLTVAAGAAQLGASVVLIEANRMGGDCTNYGCIPSKSFLAAAKAARYFRASAKFGIKAVEPEINFLQVNSYIHSVIDTVAIKDSEERFKKLGVTVLKGRGYFLDKNTVQVADTIIKARRFVVATGSKPAIPSIPGLDGLTYYTNETIFDLTEKPQHLIIVGGGPVGCELGQAYALLGVKVTILESSRILAHDEADLVSELRKKLLEEGIAIFEGAKLLQADYQDNNIQISFTHNQQQQAITGSHLLVATGRKARVENLDLEKAEIAYSPKGITVDKRLRTTNRRVYAIGDAVGPFLFTHMANYQAGIVIRNVLFRWPAKVNYREVPWVTYTHPELAHVGQTLEEAQKNDPRAQILTLPLSENDRAETEGEITGSIKAVIGKGGRVLGVSILATNAGELLMPWILAVQNQQKIGSFINVIIPYPTSNEISKQVAGEYYKPLLFSPRIRKLVKFLSKFG